MTRRTFAPILAAITISLAPSAWAQGSIPGSAQGVVSTLTQCLSAAGQSAAKIAACRNTAMSQLSALEAQAKGLKGEEKTQALSSISSARSSVATQVASASSPPKPAEAAPESRAVRRSKDTRGSGRGKIMPRRRPAPKLAVSAQRPSRELAPRRPDSAGSESYKSAGVNPMTETSKDNLSTFGVDVDTGSYVITRRKLTEGALPPKESVRVEEFVNYFRYEYPAPKKGAFSVDIEAAPSPFTAKKNSYLMRVGVQGKALKSKERKPVHLTFLVDVSGSMNRPDKLGLAQDSLKILTNNLKPEDTVSLVTYAGSTRVVLAPTGMYERGKILGAIGELTAGGSTAMESGMDLAYRQALTNFKRDHVNRVIVLSDGDTNIGARDEQELMREIKKYVDEGVTLSMIGLGMGNYKDSLMEQLANKGNGNYYYIDTLKEARKVFGDQMDGTLQVIAKDVKIQVEFDKKSVTRYRLIGYENRDIADKDFRDDKVDAGEIGAGHSVTALYEVELSEAPSSTIATVRIRHKQPEGAKASEDAFGFKKVELRSKLSDASRDFQFVAAVAGFAEILRESPYARELNLALIKELAQSASTPKQLDRAEFIELVERAQELKK